MFGEDQQWTEAARRLGFVLYDAAAAGIGFHDGASFSHLKRAMGGPARAPFTSAHWMYGTRQVFAAGPRPPHTVEVLVLVEVVSAGSSTTTYTYALARIDPPLVVGMRLGQTSWLARTLVHAPNPFGDPAIDERVRLDARDAHRAMLLLASRGGPAPNIVGRLAAITDASISVCDSSVALFSSDGVVTNHDILAGRVDRAVAIAAAIVEQNAWLPPHTGHAVLEGIFRGFGDSHRLAFDPNRLRLEGEVAGGTSAHRARERAWRALHDGVRRSASEPGARPPHEASDVDAVHRDVLRRSGHRGGRSDLRRSLRDPGRSAGARAGRAREPDAAPRPLAARAWRAGRPHRRREALLPLPEAPPRTSRSCTASSIT